MMERYFIAVSLPSSISKVIEDAQKKFLGAHLVMKPFQPHITLLPPNVLDRLPPESIVPQIKETANKYLPIDIRLTKTEVFENRVLYIEAESPKLVELQKELMGLIPEQYKNNKVIRHFQPHVTLVQAKPKQDLDSQLVNNLDEAIAPVLPYNFTAQKISKFKWLRPRTYQDTEI